LEVLVALEVLVVLEDLREHLVLVVRLVPEVLVVLHM
jgi:hypothetical protein